MTPYTIQYLAQQTAAPSSPPAGAPEKPAQEGPSQYLFPVMIVAMFAAMWFLMIRPQRKEEKRKKEMLSALKKGDSVVTSSGIIGTVANLKDDTVTLKVGDGTKIDFVRSAVSSVRSAGSPQK